MTTTFATIGSGRRTRFFLRLARCRTALHHAGGAHSHVWTSAVAAESGPRLRLLGSRAAFVITGMDSQEDALLAGRRPDGRDWGREPTERWGRLTIDGRSEPVPSEPGAYPDFYTGVVDMLRHGAPPPVDPADAVTTLTVLEAARRSATERRVVTPRDCPMTAGPEAEPRELVLTQFDHDDAWKDSHKFGRT